MGQRLQNRFKNAFTNEHSTCQVDLIYNLQKPIRVSAVRQDGKIKRWRPRFRSSNLAIS